MTLSVEVNRSEFYARLIKEMRGFAPDLEKTLTKRISTAAKPVIDEMRREVRGVKTTATYTGPRQTARQRNRPGGGQSAARARADFATRNNTVNLAEATDTGKRAISQRAWDRKREKAASLREQVAMGVRLANRKTGGNAGIIIRTSANRLPGDQKALPRAMNKGTWRHPLFGRETLKGKKKPEHWVEQTVKPAGWFSETAKRSVPKMRREVEQALDDAVMELAIRGRQ